MMHLKYRYVFFICLLLGMGVQACNEDEQQDVDREELLIGKWTTTEIEIVTMIGNESVVDYLVNQAGLSTAEAAVQEALLNSYLERELTVDLTFFADYTYESQFAGGMDGGTWSLDSDGKTLTLIEGGEEIIAIINSITESTLMATMSGEISYDIDSEPNTPDVMIDASANLTMEKQN